MDRNLNQNSLRLSLLLSLLLCVCLCICVFLPLRSLALWLSRNLALNHPCLKERSQRSSNTWCAHIHRTYLGCLLNLLVLLLLDHGQHSVGISTDQLSHRNTTHKYIQKHNTLTHTHMKRTHRIQGPDFTQKHNTHIHTRMGRARRRPQHVQDER